MSAKELPSLPALDSLDLSVLDDNREWEARPPDTGGHPTRGAQRFSPHGG